MVDVVDSDRTRVDVSTGFMVDASTLLTEAGLAWIEESDPSRSGIFVSAALYRALEEGADELLLRFAEPEQREFVFHAREVLPGRLESVEKFSHRSVRSLPRRAEAVRGRLLDVGGLEGELLADEFVYLVSNSWLVAKSRHILDELRRAGARVREYAGGYGDRLVHELIAQVIPADKIPKELTAEVIAKAGIKWVVTGGATLGLLGATSGISAAAGFVLPPAIKAFDP
jgi:hypothetical protein